jgi:hypothetical protein
VQGREAQPGELRGIMRLVIGLHRKLTHRLLYLGASNALALGRGLGFLHGELALRFGATLTLAEYLGFQLGHLILAVLVTQFLDRAFLGSCGIRELKVKAPWQAVLSGLDEPKLHQLVEFRKVPARFHFSEVAFPLRFNLG